MILTCLICFVMVGFNKSVYSQNTSPLRVGTVRQLTDTKGKTIAWSELATLFGPNGQGYISKNDPLHFRDILQLSQSHLFVDLQFNNLNTRAIMGVSYPKPIERKINLQGSYEIRRDSSVALNPLQLVVRQGTMVIQHLGGKLQAVAAGIKTDIIGTTVLFYVDPGDSTGYVYLQKGTVQFTDFNMLESGKNRLWQLNRGAPPVEIRLSRKEKKDWNEETKYHTENVWKARKPLLKRPGFYVAVGAVGVAAWLLIPDKNDEHQGNVTITLPN